MMPIDVVILWVDGSDPAIIRKHELFSDNPSVFKRNDIGGMARFTDTREIEYCVSSILTFAPFIRNIFIVTDNQDPRLDTLLTNRFPDRRDSVKIVDHKVIFRGYEDFLPTFNCNSLETMMWRIPDLSERFIYFNDDVFLAAPTSETDFFTEDGVPVGYWKPVNRQLMALVDSVRRQLGFKHFILNSARLAHSNIIPLLGHTPMSLTRSGMKRIFEGQPQWIRLNLQNRFRNSRQFNPQALYYLLEQNVRRSFLERRIFIKPTVDKKGYMVRKLKEADEMKDLIFGCINSLDQATEQDKQLFNIWFEKRLRND